MKRQIILPVILWTSVCMGAPAQRCPPVQMGQTCPSSETAATENIEPSLNIGAGNPIHLVTGNKYQRDTDLPALANSPGLEIVRHYNSQDQRSGPLGRGWSFSYDIRLYQVNNNLQIIQADGSRIIFHCQSKLVCSSEEAGAGIVQIMPQGWQWNVENGRQLSFDSNGYLNHVLLKKGVGWTITRHNKRGPLIGQILAVQDSQDKVLDFHYDITSAGPRLARITTPVGEFVYHHSIVAQQTIDSQHLTDSQPSINSQRSIAPQAIHRLEGVTRPDGMVRHYFYEAAWQSDHPFLLTGISLSDSISKAELRTQSWAYDSQGRAILSTQGDHYSNQNRVEIEYMPAPSPAKNEHETLTRVRSNAGLTKFHILQRASRYVLQSVQGQACYGCAAPGLRAEYDTQGHLKQLNDLQIQRDARGHLKAIRPKTLGWPGLSFEYAPTGYLKAWSSHDTRREVRQYDQQGRLISRQYADGGIWKYEYDELGQVIKITMTTQQKVLSTTLKWQNQRVIEIFHPYENERRRYDQQGNLIERKVTRPIFPTEPGLGDQNTFHYVDHYAWNKEGKLLRHELPEGGQLDYRWTPEQTLKSIVWQEANGQKHVLLRTQANHAAGYLYGNGLRLRGLVQKDNLTTLMLDNPKASESSPIWMQTLSYDGLGRIHAETIGTYPSTSWEKIAYQYDHQSRLIGARRWKIPLIAFYKKKLRAIQPKHLENRWYAWRDSGASLATSGIDQKIYSPIKHNMSGLPTDIGTRHLQYGADRRLSEVFEKNQLLTQYKHNIYGERIWRRTQKGETHYIYDANQLSAHIHRLASGEMAVVRRYVYAQHVPIALIEYAEPAPLLNQSFQFSGSAATSDSLAADHFGAPSHLVSAALYAIHTDAIGAPRLMTDSFQHIRWQAQFSPTGQAIKLQGDLNLPLRLPGQVYDETTGWHDNYLRTYDPQRGHYLEPDPLGPLSNNQVYGYAAEQPRRYADPLGLLLFAFDGTRNDWSSLTNVSLMSRWYQQGAYHYVAGPGNPDHLNWDAISAESAATIVGNQWEQLLADLAASRNWQASQSIDLIGFSRGAALARYFGNQIAAHIKRGRFWVRDSVRGVVTACINLRFMGLFDTVKQFGLLGASDHLYDTSISALWHWVAHAVALNERRQLFPLTTLTKTGSNRVEAPFIGAHADIGGGYLVDTENHTQKLKGSDLSNVALNWMLWQAKVAGVEFKNIPDAYRHVHSPLLHDERSQAERYRLNSDRAVNNAQDKRLFDRQAQSKTFGKLQRQEVEAFIERKKKWDFLNEWVAGQVDMHGYETWLHNRLKWKSTP